MVVHLGVVLIGVALAGSQSYSTEREVTLGVGESATVAGHTVEFVGDEVDVTPQRTEVRALVRVDGGQVYAPTLQEFPQGTQTIGTPSVRTGFTEDVYLALVSAPTGDSVTLRVIVQPLILWLWVGGVLMFVGTVLAAFPGRRRDPLDPTSAPVPAEAAGRVVTERPPELVDA
jgi:cytochrome c-type biogenesis protein CcmF